MQGIMLYIIGSMTVILSEVLPGCRIAWELHEPPLGGWEVRVCRGGIGVTDWFSLTDLAQIQDDATAADLAGHKARAILDEFKKITGGN